MSIRLAHCLAAMLPLALCLPALARAQFEVIDPALLTQTQLKIECDLSTLHSANDCVARLAPTLMWRANSHVAQMATYMIKVKIKKHLDGTPIPDTATPSVGTAFLIDANRGYFLTAKHVLMGATVWSSNFPDSHLFADLETAIEDHLYSNQNAEIELYPDEGLSGISGVLLALDRNSDLALVAVSNPRAITMSAYPALHRKIPFAPGMECPNPMVSAVGFADSPQGGGKRERRSTDFGLGSCDAYPKTYFIGGKKYRIALFSTRTKFEPGYSGGPVLDRNLQLVGVVSGATTTQRGTEHNFFVPLASVKAFLGRFQ